MKTIALTATAAVSVLALTGAAHAQSLTADPYVGAGVTVIDGAAELNAATGRAGLNFGDYLGVEAEASTGITDDYVGAANVDLDHLAAVFGRVRAPLTPSLEAFAKGGFYTAQADVELAGAEATLNDDDFAAGAGLEWAVSGPHALRADYTNYGLDDDGHSGALSYVFHF